MFSVALSVPGEFLPRSLGITQRPALRSPDFPHLPCGKRDRPIVLPFVFYTCLLIRANCMRGLPSQLLIPAEEMQATSKAATGELIEVN